MLAAVLVDLLLQRRPGGVEPLQVAEDHRQGRGQARIVTMVQMLGDLLFVGLVLHLMVGAVKLGLRRRAAASAGFPDSSNQGDAGPAN